MSEEAPAAPARRASRPRKSGLQDAVKAGRAAAPAVKSDVQAELEREFGAVQPPMRTDMRGGMRETREQSLARAKTRADEILEGGLPDEGPDEFWIDPDIIPWGWSYEWKAYSVLNKEDTKHQNEVRRGGWDEVPASRHPEMMPPGQTEGIIERKGMVLVERPLEVTKRVQMRDVKNARAQVRSKLEQLALPKQGQFSRENKGDSLVRRSTSYEPFAPQQVPDE